MIITLLALSALTFSSEKHPSEQLTVEIHDSLKFGCDYHNPLLDHIYTADPTAVEHEGRLYVYGTNDQQQCDEVHPDSANTYEHINSLVMMSTRDMVNWTYHGQIHTKQLAPWIIASWAPSVCSRREEDGQTHFYLYYSNSGFGTGVLTSTSPVGPWTSPLDHSIVDSKTPGLGDCTVPFDPGVVIDDEGNGWLAFGAGKARLARLSKDMLAFDSPFVTLPAPYHFEANELNVIGGRLVYTYNLDWTDKEGWKEKAAVPTRCSMGYMLPDGDPLDEKSWHYQDYYIKNPGEDGFDYSNNHTHLHKYEGKWYIFHHTMILKNAKHHKGGYRNISVDEITVDEATQHISFAHATNKGVSQIHTVNPFEQQEMEATFATHRICFEEDSTTCGNMLVKSDDVGAIKVKGVEFSRKGKSLEFVASGKGQIDVHLDNPDGELIASTFINGDTSTSLLSKPKGIHDLIFIISGETLKVDKWKFNF
ncbi:MAG: glycoside hydrolase family 43 protein [Bacteroidaceae bacterium]|nr:glycoside hydrolase family 43 protein [Bacteroidaceae bacterium]